MSVVRLRVEAEGDCLRLQLTTPTCKPVAGVVEGVHLEGWRGRQVEWPQMRGMPRAGIEDRHVERAQADMGKLVWDNAPGIADAIAAQAAGAGPGAERRSLDANAERLDGGLVIALELAGTPAEVQLLHLLPWELLPRPDDRGRGLVGPRCELVRLLPPARLDRHAATAVHELAGHGGPVFQTGVFASPLCASGHRAMEAFNAAPVAAFLERQARVGFLRPGSVEHLADAKWQRFRDAASVVKFFFGHGVATEGDATLSFFHGHGHGWHEEAIASPALAAMLDGAREGLVGLIACYSYRAVAAVLGRGGAVGPSMVATLARVPLEPMMHAWREGLEALSVHNDVVRMTRAMRAFLEHKAPGFERSVVLFHQAGPDGPSLPWFECVPGLSRIVDLPSERRVGWTEEQHRDVMARQAQLAIAAPGRYRPAGVVRLRRLRVSVYPITNWQAARVLDGHACPDGKELLAAEVSLVGARQYARRVGGRLLTPDEWEACAGEVRRAGQTLALDALLRGLETVPGPYQLYVAGDPDPYRGPRDPVEVTYPDGLENAHGLQQMIGGDWEWAKAEGDASGDVCWMGGSWDVGIGDCLPQWRREPFGEKAAFRVAWPAPE